MLLLALKNLRGFWLGTGPSAQDQTNCLVWDQEIILPRSETDHHGLLGVLPFFVAEPWSSSLPLKCFLTATSCLAVERH